MDPEQPGDFGGGAARSQHAEDFGLLSRREFRFAAAVPPPRTRLPQACLCPLPHHRAFVFSERSKHLHHHSPGGRCRIDGFGQGLEACTGRLNTFQDEQQILQRPGQSVEFPDDEHISRREAREQAGKFRTVPAAYQMLGEHYSGIRRWAPAFLDAFEFQSVPAAASLMRAIGILRDMNRAATLDLPKSAPTSFIRDRWARHVLSGDGIDRRYYELCVLSELRDRLRAGDVWVVGSRRYRSFEERLISRETLRELEQGGTLPIAVDPDFDRFIAARRALLDERLTAIDVKAKGNLLPDVTLDKGALKITPIEKSTPPEAEVLAERLYAMLPRVRVTDLLRR